ncbi:YfiR family protein [Fulvivirga ulvae]|uniref:YfiR family protein n=1 Tax=Fulvivirga ulvae TaxID=2904245 RepID=UPI001F268DAB|nr:YfiR family protein [Fulvivirga ulvae]UII34840.1 YfiR family protein [Fulvivirga ulvae]
MKRSIFITCAMLFAFLLVPLFGYSQNRPIHEIHAMMIYNFTKYIQWPGYQPSQDFIVAVIGSDDVYNTLNTWYGGQERGNKKFVIKKFSSPSDIQNCHILYVGKGNSKQFDDIKAKLGGASTLLITDKPGLGKEGSGINFVTEGNKLSIELNQSALDAANLKVSSQLTSIAKLI